MPPNTDGRSKEAIGTRVIRANSAAKYADIIVAVVLIFVGWYFDPKQNSLAVRSCSGPHRGKIYFDGIH